MALNVKFTDTTLRDAHQSLLATRMRLEDMVPIAEEIDGIGYWSVEVWGGATFDTCMRFLKEDPWERLRVLKSAMPNSPLQMLLRGQNLVGYRHYADDLVNKFVELAVRNGISVFRIFDALNDIRNLKTSIKAVVRNGGHVEGTVCYTISPVHNNAMFVDMAKKLEDMGCDTICIKDMAGLLSPFDAYDLISEMKRHITAPLHLHCHDTSGMGVSTYLKAIEAGVDIVDTAISSMAYGTSQPPVEVIVNALSSKNNSSLPDMRKLKKISTYFKKTRKKYSAFESEHTGCDPDVLIYQIPGGMISNLATQLKEQGALDKMEDVLAEVPLVRKEMGYPPLVTPSSQIVGTQATLNVLTGERYKMITSETKNFLKGLYGRPPSPVDETVRKNAIGDEEYITVRPADLLEPEFDKLDEKIKKKGMSEEDIISYLLFPKVALEFFEFRDKSEQERESILRKDAIEATSKKGTDSNVPWLAPTEFNISVHGESYHVKVGGVGHKTEGSRPFFLYVDGRLEEVFIESLHEVVPAEVGQIDSEIGGVSKRPKANTEGDITTTMPGSVIAVKVEEGQKVSEGETVLIVEAMKMENEIHSNINGTVAVIYVKEGDKVNPDEVLLSIKAS